VNAKLIEDIANAVLYEGYMLYPYRPSSVKNRQRWNFGVVYPKAYSEMQNGTDNWFMQTECLAKGRSSAELNVKVRFLQQVARTVGELKTPLDEWPVSTENNREPDFRIVQTLQVGDQVLQTWQEAIERETTLPAILLSDGVPVQCSPVLNLPGGREMEPICNTDGRVAGLIIRTKEPIVAKVDVAVAPVHDGLFKITVRISNVTVTQGPDSPSRDFALMQSLLSAHSILGINGGEFISLVDPPDELKEIVSQCNNVGTWPVLAGDEGQPDGMLSTRSFFTTIRRLLPKAWAICSTEPKSTKFLLCGF